MRNEDINEVKRQLYGLRDRVLNIVPFYLAKLDMLPSQRTAIIDMILLEGFGHESE